MPLAVPPTHPVLPPTTATLLCLAHPDDPQARDAARIAQCQERVARAWSAERPRRLLEAIRSGGCSALLSGGPGDAVTCRICPEGQAWEHVAGYYRGAKQKVRVVRVPVRVRVGFWVAMTLTLTLTLAIILALALHLTLHALPKKAGHILP